MSKIAREVGLDIGRRNTKVVSDNYVDLFLTTAMMKNNKYDADKTNSIIIVNSNNNNRYIVGDPAGNAISNDDKSIDNTFEVCLYYALSKFDDTNFNVTTGLPINHLKLYKDALETKYTGKVVSIERPDGSLKYIRINSLTVKPEGVLCIDEDDDGDFILVDIGGLTVDVALYRDFVLTKASSYELGVRKMYSNVADDLSKQYGVDYNIDDVERYMEKEYIVYNEELHPFDFTDYKINHLSKIMEAIKDEYPWKKCLKKFVGGGSVVFQDILSAAKLRVSGTAIYDNANAFYESGVADNDN